MRPSRDPLQREIHRLDLLFAAQTHILSEHIALDLLEQKARLEERKRRVFTKLVGRFSDS
jgi:hypothetical protein